MRRARRRSEVNSAPIFVSHSSKDKRVARAVADHLRRQGRQVWIDEAGIAGGKEWRSELTQALRQSWVVVLLVTLESMLSKWVIREIEAADDLGKKIIPVIVEDVPYSESLKLVLNRLQRVEVGPNLQGLGRLDAALSAQELRAGTPTPGRRQVIIGTVMAGVGWIGLLASLVWALSPAESAGDPTIAAYVFMYLFMFPGSISGIVLVAGILLRRAGRKKGI